MTKKISLKKETVDRLKTLTGSRAVEFLHVHVNQNGKGLEDDMEQAFQDLDNNTDTWGEMLSFLGALLDNDCIVRAPESVVEVVIE